MTKGLSDWSYWFFNLLWVRLHIFITFHLNVKFPYRIFYDPLTWVCSINSTKKVFGKSQFFGAWLPTLKNDYQNDNADEIAEISFKGKTIINHWNHILYMCLEFTHTESVIVSFIDYEASYISKIWPTLQILL